MQRVLIWDVPTRLFHWLLAGGVLTAFCIAQFAGEHSPLFPYHAMIGVVLIAMVALRILWGIIGTRYARFGSFLFGPVAVVHYFKGIVTRQPNTHIGHNPGSSYAIFTMLGLVVAIVVSGLLLSNGNEALEDVHGLLTYVLLGVAALHVAGVVIHTVRHRENIIGSMVTGTKNAAPEAGIRSSAPVATIVAVSVLTFLAVGLSRNYDPATRSTTLPLIGTSLQLGESEGGEEAGGTGQAEGDDD